MNEAPNPQPARRADAHRLADQLSGDPLAPGAARFLCQSINGQPKLVFQFDRRSMWCRNVSQGVDVWHGGCWMLRLDDVLTSKWEGKNRVFSLEKLRFFDLVISG